jgi:hypothetical protein
MFCVDLRTAIISLYSINLSVFITEAESVYCAVRPGSLNETDSFVLKGLLNQPSTISYILFTLCTDIELLFGSVYISLARIEPPKIPSQEHTHSISLPGLRTIKALTCNLLTFANEANTVKCKRSSATWGLCHDFKLSRSRISMWVCVYVRCCNC